MIADTIIEIMSVAYRAPYTLVVTFDDGHISTIDFKSFLFSSQHPDIIKYQDTDLFQQFSIDGGDLQWNEYELCFSLGTLYDGIL